MFQGISSCIGNPRVRGSWHQFPWRCSYQILAAHMRHLTASATAAIGGGAGGSCNSGSALEKNLATPLIDKSFTATHYVGDGRTFEFATVIVKSMNKGRSPLNVWQHACSLIRSGCPPTFGVAFISKPSESAKQAIQVFAQQLTLITKPSADSFLKSDPTCSPPEGGQVETSRVSNISHDTTESLSPLSEFRASGAAPGTGENSDGQNTDIPPIIGCILDDMGDFESSETSQNGNLLCRVQTHLTSKASVAGTRRASAFGFNQTQFDDDSEDEATLSDWEGVCTDYAEEAVKGNVEVWGKVDEDHEEEEPTAESSSFSHNEDISKEGLVTFLNALTKPPQTLSERTGVSEDFCSLESSERNVIKQSKKLDGGILPNSLVLSKIGHCLMPTGNPGDKGLVSGGAISADDGEASPIEIWNGGTKPVVGKESGLESSDEDYKLLLCLGHMPGAKAVAFHSSTTGLPRLPDLEKAVTVNNPHMLLLGASGFVFPEFIQRISSVFPSSCRAGAFLAPLYSSEKSQWTKVVEKKISPLFFGSNVSTTGVVGLSISAKGKGEEVPADAFAEMVRMSVAFPRIPGFVFLDETISKKLFLPKNVAPQHLSFSSGSTLPGYSSEVLDQLSKRLLKENTVPTVPKSFTYSDKETIEELGLSKGSTVPLSGSRALQISEKVPLALFDAVLFPGWSLPFYIFEPCYRSMVKHCIEEGRPFGLSAMYNASWTTDADQSGEVFGTVANLKVHSFQRDCRSYIIAHGLRRFRVRNERIWAEPGSFGLTMGEVQFFDDKECETNEEKEELAELAKRAVALCIEVIPEGVKVPSLVKSTHDPIVASFAVGHVMDVPARVKKRWLKLVDTKIRLLEQIAFLEIKTRSMSS